MAPPPEPAAYRRWYLWLVLGISLVHWLSSWNKPPHIDDPLYLETSRYLLKDPLHPLCNEYLWEQRARPIYRFALNPPLYNYLQAGVMAVFREDGPLMIPALHLLSSLFILLMAWSGLWLARRFTSQPALAVLLLMTAPTLMPSTNLMLDVPAAATLMAALAAWIKGVDLLCRSDLQSRLTGSTTLASRTRSTDIANATRSKEIASATRSYAPSRKWLLIGALLAGASLLIKYNSVFVLPLMAVYALLYRKPRVLTWLAIPAGILAIWCLHNYVFFPNHDVHLLVSMERFTIKKLHWWYAIPSTVITLGSSFYFFPALLMWAVPRVRWVWIVLTPALVGWFIGAKHPMIHPGVFFDQETVFFLINGSLLILFLILAGVRRFGDKSLNTASDIGPTPPRDTLFLIAWIVIIATFLVINAHQHAPRYFFGVFAPIALLLTRAVASPPPAWSAWFRNAAWASAAFQFVLALVLAAADNEFVNQQTRVVEAISNDPRVKGREVYFVGGWGLQYQGQRRGWKRLSVDDPPTPKGSILVFPKDMVTRENPIWMIRRHRLGHTLNRELLRDLEKYEQQPRWPLQTVSHENQAFLYNSVYGEYVPYRLTRPRLIAIRGEIKPDRLHWGSWNQIAGVLVFERF